MSDDELTVKRGEKTTIAAEKSEKSEIQIPARQKKPQTDKQRASLLKAQARRAEIVQIENELRETKIANKVLNREKERQNDIITTKAAILVKSPIIVEPIVSDNSDSEDEPEPETIVVKKSKPKSKQKPPPVIKKKKQKKVTIYLSSSDSDEDSESEDDSDEEEARKTYLPTPTKSQKMNRPRLRLQPPPPEASPSYNFQSYFL